MPNLNIFYPKKHIWHKKINLVFLAVFSFSIVKGPYDLNLKANHLILNNEFTRVVIKKFLKYTFYL